MILSREILEDLKSFIELEEYIFNESMKSRIYVGTSGWLYSWNIGGSLDWYARESGLNAVELNASFYRYPTPSQISSWKARGRGIRWSVKIHRIISHVYRLSQRSYESWRRFSDLFNPMRDLIDFYLLQLPPSYILKDENIERLRSFIKNSGADSQIAVEFRHRSWFERDPDELCGEMRGAVIVSVDSPQASWFACCRGYLYLRLHGRSSWYLYEYSSDELSEIARRIRDLNPENIYIFFNNDHWMLENARTMKRILERIF
ncbi:MAG: DUF72 domain-containing protein [Sulfolobales archaeon]